ncbi:MAG: hypothetical protein ACM3TT_13280 [Syntrophothermus sp.]
MTTGLSNLTDRDPAGERVSLVIFEGGAPASEVEWLVVRARWAIARDTARKAGEVEEIDRIILSTNYPELAREAVTWRIPDLEVELDRPGEAFHLGKRLWELIKAKNLKKVLYMGGASVPLIAVQELKQICAAVDKVNTLCTNNIWSGDLVAFNPADALGLVPLPATDNELPMLLRDRAGLKATVLPRSVGVSFDVDTPADLEVLALHPGSGSKTREALTRLGLDTGRIQRAAGALMDPRAEVFIFGRLGAGLYGYLDAHTECKLRVVSEERGMRALGRLARGEVISLLGLFLEDVGEARFFQYLGRVCHAAFIDTRVLFAHMKRNPSRSDRFNSDLGRAAEIQDDYVRRFTETAMAAPIPVILGGHSLVSGGLMALVDAALAR